MNTVIKSLTALAGVTSLFLVAIPYILLSSGLRLYYYDINLSSVTTVASRRISQ